MSSMAWLTAWLKYIATLTPDERVRLHAAMERVIRIDEERERRRIADA